MPLNVDCSHIPMSMLYVYHMTLLLGVNWQG